MKKIRLLALLLALLMIPFGMLFACKDDEDPNDDDPSDEEPGDDDDETSGPQQNIVYDDDGANTDGGYLMYFHFNAAEIGMLGIVPPSADTLKPESEYILEPPYSNYLEGTLVNGASYTIRKDGDRSFLAMERRNYSGAPTVKVKVEDALGSDIDADHMLAFDIYFEDGLFGSPIDVYGTKNEAKSKFTFLSIENGAIKDCTGNTVYGEKPTDKTGWINVALVISEQGRKYDIYVDGIRQTDGAAMPSADSYPAWTNYKPYTYCIGIRNAGNDDTFCFLDNLCMKNGNENTLGIYKGEDSSGVHYASVPAYENLVKLDRNDVASKFASLANATKNAPFSSSLLMANGLSLSKITTVGNEKTGTVEDLVLDYGAETGAYTDGNVSILNNGNAYFTTWIEPDEDNELYSAFNVIYKGYITYDSDKTDTTEPVNGTYTIDGSGLITFDWGENTAPKIGDTEIKYAKYAGNDLTVYTDATAATAVESGVYTLYKAEEPYGYVTYANIGEGTKYTLKVDPFLGLAYLKVVPTEGEPTEGMYPYTVSENTVTVNSLAFNYNVEANSFAIDDVVLNKVTDSIELGEGENLALKWTNFATGGYKELKYPIDKTWWNANKDNYDTFVFEFYASKEMVDDGFQFLVQFDCGSSQNPQTPGAAYWSFTLDSDSGSYKYVEGWNRFEVVITETGISRDPQIENLQNIKVIIMGWSAGPSSETAKAEWDVPNDGYTMYISKLAFCKNTYLELKGPDLGKEKCNHQSDMGDDLYVPVADPIPANCVHGEYYIEKCSNCGATRLDTTKPVGDPGGHQLNPETKYLAPTCDERGYYYLECEDCGYHSVQEYIDAKGHNYYINADWTTKKVTYLCVVCSEQTEETIFEENISIVEKIDNKDYNVKAGVKVNAFTNNDLDWTNDKGDNKGFGDAGLQITGASIGGPVRCATVKSSQVAGRYAIEVIHNGLGSESTQHSYWSVTGQPKEENYNFVFEIDIMLGKKMKDGKYISQSFSCVERSNGSRDFTIFSVDNDGVGKLGTVNGATNTVQLSDTKFTNIVIVYSSNKNTIALYADGYFVDEAPFKHSSFANAGETKIQEFRWNMQSSGDIAGGSTYFGGLCWYETDEPICIVTDIPMTEEVTGDIVLKDELGHDMRDAFTVNAVDVETFLAVDVFSSKYVVEFTLNGTDLADGAILRGTKRATGYNRYEDLVTVKDGKVYVGTRLVSETTENVKIALICDDTSGTIGLKVNGVLLDGTESYANADYAEFSAYLRGLTFLNDCGSYDISGLKMYTGTTAQ